ncbi:YadA-like family protein [Salmonella enterica]
MKKSVLAVIVAMTVAGVAHADTIEGAKTELSAISAGMSQAEKQQKIDRFIERVGDAAAAHQYLVQNGFVAAPANTMDTDTKVFLADVHANGTHSADVVREWNALTYNQQQDALAAKPALRSEMAASIKAEPVLYSAELGGKHTTNETHNGTKPGEAGPHLDGTHWVMTPGITKESNPKGEPVPQGELVTDPAKWTGQPGITKETNPKGNPIEISHDFDSVEPAKQPQTPAVAHEAVVVKPRSVLLAEAAARAAKAGNPDIARTFLTRAKEAQIEERAAAQVESNNASRAAYAAQTGKSVVMISPATPAVTVVSDDVTGVPADQIPQHFEHLAAEAARNGDMGAAHQYVELSKDAQEVLQERDQRDATHAAVQAGKDRVVADEVAEEAAKRDATHAAVQTGKDRVVADEAVEEVAKRDATHAAVQAGENRAVVGETVEEIAKRDATHQAVAAQTKDEENAEKAKVVATHEAVAAQVKDEENAEAAKVVATHIAVQAQTKDEENAEKAKVVAVQNAIQAGKNKAETSAKGDEEVMGLLSSNQERTASQHVDGVAAQAADNATAIKTEKAVRTQQFNTLADGVAVAQATGEYAQSRADAAYANTQENRRALDNTNKRVAQNSADIADHEQRITSLEQSTTSKFGALKNEVEQNRKRASAGIAGVAAMANIPQVTQGATFSVGAGVGNTDGESALAVGASARINDSWVVKGSVSNDTQHNFVVGAGASYQW